MPFLKFDFPSDFIYVHGIHKLKIKGNNVYSTKCGGLSPLWLGGISLSLYLFQLIIH